MKKKLPRRFVPNIGLLQSSVTTTTADGKQHALENSTHNWQKLNIWLILTQESGNYLEIIYNGPPKNVVD